MMSSNTSENKNQKVSSNEKFETAEVYSEDETESVEGKLVKSNSVNELDELRRLLIQPAEVSEVLPAAVERRSNKDKRLTNATLPIVEENIRQSVNRDPKILAEALFPVIGPAIRKAISEALSTMVQSFNQTLEHSISPKSLRWRIEAFQTGKSFGEVVMLKTLVYRVEQVFLIHKDTGLLLQHLAANPQDAEDADMVSAMLTAITDFVHDSFKTSDDAVLDSLKIRELSVWIESSPDAVIAAVIRGNPPLALRQIFVEAIEDIQLKQENDLNNFSGRADIFDRSRPILQKCLQFQTSQEDEEAEKKGFFNPATILVSILGLMILIGGFFYVRDYLRWSGYLEQLRSEQGIVITDAERGWLTHSISGLRDPLANDPTQFLQKYSLETDEVQQNWKPFQDGSPEFVLKRAEKTLRPPKDVNLKLVDQTLIAEGNVSQEWFDEASRSAPFLFGVNEFKLADGGVSQIISKIEAQNIEFICNTMSLAEGQAQKLDTIADDFENLIDLNKKFQINMHGFANSTGAKEANIEVSRKRAEIVLNELETRSNKIKNLQQTNSKFINIFAEGADRQSEDCKVTFKINPL